MADSPTPRRAVCARCRRPLAVCYCAHIPTLPTRTSVLLLQHPRERHVAIGTARMAHLALPNSVFRVGVDFSCDPVVQEMVSRGTAIPAYVLFPGSHAIAVADLPRDSPLTLVVLDGTWALARKLLKLNPFLRALPQVAFTPTHPSDYRIRRQPDAMCVSTIEALAEVLDILEPDPRPPPARGSFGRLLEPFHAMVAMQEHFINDVHARRHHHNKRRSSAHQKSKVTLAERLRADWARLVCVQGEANAWPRRSPERQEPELIHWVAVRPATGEAYQAVIAPRNLLALSTPRYAELTEPALAAGVSTTVWRKSWREFVHPGDVVVSWGGFYLGLAEREGLDLPDDDRLDLRREVARQYSKRWRNIDDALDGWGADGRSTAAGEAPVDAARTTGRAGRRLATLVSLLGRIASEGVTIARMDSGPAEVSKAADPGWRCAFRDATD